MVVRRPASDRPVPDKSVDGRLHIDPILPGASSHPAGIAVERRFGQLSVTVQLLVASTLPALSVERYSITCAPRV